MARRLKERISQPWERRYSPWRRLQGRIRWTTVLGLVLGMTAAGGLYRYAAKQLEERDTQVAITKVKRAVARFRDDIGRCPRSTVELVHPPVAGARYIDSMPTDGWGRELWVQCPGHFDPEQADVVSSGPSGSFLVDDNFK